MAEYTGQGVNSGDVFRGGNTFMRELRSGGMTIQIDPVVPGAIIVLHFGGSLVDKRRADDTGVCRFYDLDPGNYVANSVFDGQTGAAWSVIVTPSTYTVTRISSTSPGGFVAQR